MAYNFYNDNWEDSNPHDWDNTPAGFWDDATQGHGWDDEFGQMLFDMAFVDPETGDVRAQAYRMLQEWFRDEYGLEFDEVFDWAGWREWYG